jgi:hypothetical protein
MPAEARGTSKKSAKAFARHYVDLVNFAAKTGRTRALADAGASGCESCMAIVENVHSIYARGGHIRGGEWDIDVIRVPQLDEDRAVLDLGLTLKPQVVVSQNGEEKRYSGSKQPMTMFLITDAGRWRVARLDLVT